MASPMVFSEVPCEYPLSMIFDRAIAPDADGILSSDVEMVEWPHCPACVTMGTTALLHENNTIEHGSSLYEPSADEVRERVVTQCAVIVEEQMDRLKERMERHAANATKDEAVLRVEREMVLLLGVVYLKIVSLYALRV